MESDSEKDFHSIDSEHSDIHLYTTPEEDTSQEHSLCNSIMELILECLTIFCL